jgi:hypothetical protein
MDKLSELSHGAKVVLGAGILLLIFSFFDWFTVEGTSYGQNMWSGVGVLAGLLLIVLLVWQAIRLANINLEIGVTPSMITAALAVLTFIFVFIRWIDKPGASIVGDAIDRSIWAWICLALALVILVGAWLNMQAAGEGLSDIRSRVESMTSGSGGGAAAAPAAPAAPDSPPAAPPAPPAAEPAPPAAEPEAAGGDDEPRSA